MTVPIPPISLTDAGTATSGINGAPVIQWGSPFAVGSHASADADNQARANASGAPSSGNGGGAIGAGQLPMDGGGGGVPWLAVAVAAGVVGIAWAIGRS